MIELKLTNELLTTPADKFVFGQSEYDPVELSNAMTLFREKHKGVGLAANQVGIGLRVISVKGIDSALFNPKIVWQDSKQVLLPEGCLSYPGLVVKVKRPESLRVRYTTALGETKTEFFADYTARVICHEIDHLDGILFYNRANRFHKEQAMNKWRKIRA